MSNWKVEDGKNWLCGNVFRLRTNVTRGLPVGKRLLDMKRGQSLAR